MDSEEISVPHVKLISRDANQRMLTDRTQTVRPPFKPERDSQQKY